MAGIDPLTWRASHFERATRELLRAWPSVRWRVVGSCMAPALPEGSRVLLASAARVPPRVGDVVLARFADGLRLHRLVWAGGQWRTQSDRAWIFDARLRPEDVLATVVGVEGEKLAPRRVGRALRSLARTALRLVQLRLGGPGR
jgi:hypothetical protein